MLTPVVMILSFGYNQFLFMLFFSKTLERKYSWKRTICGAVFCTGLVCLFKIPIFFRIGMVYPMLLNGLVLVIECVYEFFFFQAATLKRVLAMLLFYVYMFLAEIIALRLSVMLFGEMQLMQTESNFTLVTLLFMFPLLMFGFYPLLCIWKLVLQANVKSSGKLWLSVFLPLSQYLFIENFAELYTAEQRKIPMLSIGGLFFGIIADFYMFIIFYRQNQRERAEKELCLEQQLYQKEHLYYEYLKENQKEVSRMRHDFQNYVLVFRNMLEKMQ